jgi:hypothetical protein
MYYDSGVNGVWALSDEDLKAGLVQVFAQEQALAAQRLALVREIDGRDLARRDGATCLVAWLKDRLRVSPGTARRWVELARALDSSVAAVAQALTAGAVNEEQALTISRSLDAISDVDADTRSKAEAELITLAATFEPSSLARLGARILEHVAPQLSDERLANELAAQAKDAARDRTLTLSADGRGKVRLTGWLETDAAAIVTAAIDPLTSPAALEFDDRTPGQRRADALVEVCRLALACGRLPENGGDRPQLVVTVGLDGLVGETGTGMLDNGVSLTPETVRRIACDAGVIPALLNGRSQVLDVGRERRLFTGPLRRALVLRDGGCAFPGCDRPPRWCDGHHIRHWADGGPTNLSNAVLVCGFHHRLLHHSDWQVRIAPDGLPEFVPPTWMDPQQVPRRNAYHRRT